MSLKSMIKSILVLGVTILTVFLGANVLAMRTDAVKQTMVITGKGSPYTLIEKGSITTGCNNQGEEECKLTVEFKSE